ncbi:MAG: cold shock domain-containing protein [Pseudomonadota bacterium]
MPLDADELYTIRSCIQDIEKRRNSLRSQWQDRCDESEMQRLKALYNRLGNESQPLYKRLYDGGYGNIEHDVPQRGNQFSIPVDVCDDETYLGSIKIIKKDQGFGFISFDLENKKYPAEIFFHFSGCVDKVEGFNSLSEGNKILFNVQAGQKGPMAVSLKKR